MKLVFIYKLPAIKTKKRGYAIYANFPHIQSCVKELEKLQTKYYHESVNMWELPISSLDNIMFVFSNYTVICTDKNLKKDFAHYQYNHRNIIANGEYKFNFKTQPFKHQLECYEFAKSNPRFLLADDMGLGKTKSSIDIAVSRKHTFKRCLVVCGVDGLKWNWAEEIVTHSNEKFKILGVYKNRNDRDIQGTMEERLADLRNLKDEFFIITNSASLRDESIMRELQRMTENGEIGMVVIDEIHKMKSYQSKVGMAIHRLNSYYKLALTGTPLLNNVIDLYNIFLWLGETDEPLYSFKQKYCALGGPGGYQILGYINLKQLKERLNKVQIRRLRSDVHDLPPKLHYVSYVELEPKHKKLYIEIVEELRKKIGEILISPNPLARLIRLRQVTSCPNIYDSEFGEVYGLSAKVKAVKEAVDEIVSNGYKVLVFSNWTNVTDVLEEVLKEYDPLFITGKVPDDIRRDNRLKFQNDPECKVLVGVTNSMGVGFTLHAAHYVLFVDEPWTDGDKKQAEDRAHRIGTTHPVSVITFLTKGTIDERVHEIVNGKGELSDYIVDDKVDVKSLKTVIEKLLEF